MLLFIHGGGGGEGIAVCEQFEKFQPLSSSDLEMECVESTVFQFTAAYIIYVQHMLRGLVQNIYVKPVRYL